MAIFPREQTPKSQLDNDCVASGWTMGRRWSRVVVPIVTSLSAISRPFRACRRPPVKVSRAGLGCGQGRMDAEASRS